MGDMLPQKATISGSIMRICLVLLLAVLLALPPLRVEAIPGAFRLKGEVCFPLRNVGLDFGRVGD